MRKPRLNYKTRLLRAERDCVLIRTYLKVHGHQRLFFQGAKPGSQNYGPRSHFVNDEKNILTKNLWFGEMQRFPKQSHDVRSPALEQVRSSVCGPRTKKFGDPWAKPTTLAFTTFTREDVHQTQTHPAPTPRDRHSLAKPDFRVRARAARCARPPASSSSRSASPASPRPAARTAGTAPAARAARPRHFARPTVDHNGGKLSRCIGGNVKQFHAN